MHCIIRVWILYMRYKYIKDLNVNFIFEPFCIEPFQYLLTYLRRTIPYSQFALPSTPVVTQFKRDFNNSLGWTGKKWGTCNGFPRGRNDSQWPSSTKTESKIFKAHFFLTVEKDCRLQQTSNGKMSQNFHLNLPLIWDNHRTETSVGRKQKPFSFLDTFPSFDQPEKRKFLLESKWKRTCYDTWYKNRYAQLWNCCAQLVQYSISGNLLNENHIVDL